MLPFFDTGKVFMTDVPLSFYQLILTFCTRGVSFQLQTAQPQSQKRGKGACFKAYFINVLFYVIVHI